MMTVDPGHRAFHHAIHGVTLVTPFALPGLPAAAGSDAPDVVLWQGRVPERLLQPIARGDDWQAEPGRFLLLGAPNVGRFLVQGPDRIQHQDGLQTDPAMVGFHLLHGVLAAILRHRGDLALHASAVALGGRAIAIAGASGAGKSTTTAALLQAGAGPIADDLTAIRLDASGAPVVSPGRGEVHLTADAVATLGLAGQVNRPYRNRGKAVWPVAAPPGRPLPLAALVILGVRDGARVTVRRLQGAAGFDAILEAAYGPLLPGDAARVFPLIGAVAATVAVIRIERPAGAWSLEAVIEAVLATAGQRSASGLTPRSGRVNAELRARSRRPFGVPPSGGSEPAFLLDSSTQSFIPDD